MFTPKVSIIIPVYNVEEFLKEIESNVGMEFDPTVMQAMSVEENAEYEDNTIIRVMQTGYMYKGRHDFGVCLRC